MKALPQIALSVSSFNRSRTGEHTIGVEVSPVFELAGIPSFQAHCEMIFEWSIEEHPEDSDGGSDGEMLTELELVKCNIIPNCPVSLPMTSHRIDELATEYAKRVLNTMHFGVEFASA